MFARVYQLASSTAELLRDRELRHKAETLVSEETTKSVDNVQQGVSLRARNLGRGIRAGLNGIGSGPRQIQNLLARLQTRIYEERLAALLQVARDTPVDVQIGPVLYEDAPQELRSRMWWALLENPKLVSLLGTERALEARNSARSRAASSSGSRSSGSLDGSRQGSMSNPSSPLGPTSPSSPVNSARHGRSRPQSGASHRDAGQAGKLHSAPQPLTDGSGVSTSRSNSLGFHGTSLRSRDVSPHPPNHQTTSAESASAESVHGHSDPTSSAEPLSINATGQPGESTIKPDLGAAGLDSDAHTSSAEQDALAQDQSSENMNPETDKASASEKHADATSDVKAAASSGPLGGSPSPSASKLAQKESYRRTAQPTPVFPFETPSGGASTGSSKHHESHDNDALVSVDSGKESQPQPDASADEQKACSSPSAASSSSAAAEAAARPQAETAEADGNPKRNFQPTWSPVAAAAGLPPPPSPTAERPKGFSVDSLGQPDEEERWEMVEGAAQLYNFRDSRDLQAQLHPSRMDNFSEEGETLRQRVMDSVVRVPWPLSAEYAEDSRYNTLLQISIGQEEVDEIITRDINRTFPEHPQFGFQQGQQALFRVLKAYSLHDLEVGYCQGMAFVAGLLLMYVPEEPAFRIACRLMAPRGANLRILYLPGMEGLKAMLRMFEWLLHACHPELKAHLQDNGAAPILYASQWFLTLFSCPFPAPFAARIIDILLTEDRPQILLRVAMAVMAQCEEALLKLRDFEDLITYLKVEPVRWPTTVARKVINSAVEEKVSEALLLDAQRAIDCGFQGSISRATSSVREAAAAAAVAAADTVTIQRTMSAKAEAESAASTADAEPADTDAVASTSSTPAASDAAASAESRHMPTSGQGKSSASPRRDSGDRESSVSFTSSDGCAAIEAERLAGDLALDLVWTTPDDVPEGDDNTSSSHHPEQDQTPSP